MNIVTNTRSKIVAFAIQELGLELTPGQADLITAFERGGFSAAVWQIGRRGLKSTTADILALYDATARDGLRRYLLPGEPKISAIIAPRIEGSVQHIARCARLARNSPTLSAMIVAETTEALSFSNLSEIRAYPCSARSLRGDAWSCAITDELGHYVTTEEGNAAGDRILDAAVPALAQFGDDGWLINISTPRWRQGAFFKQVERAKSGRYPFMHYHHATTAEMNPRISAAWLEQQRQADPDLFAREFLAEFQDGVSSYLTSEDVFACVRAGVKTLPPQEGMGYVAALDPGHLVDRFAMAVAHRGADGPVVIDGVWTWHRAGHAATLDAVRDVAKAYGRPRMTTDQHAAVPIREGLHDRGIKVEYRPWTNERKADAFAALKVGLNTRTVSLPDDHDLIEELHALEARPSPAGFTRIAAAPGGHDDRAIVVAAVVGMLSKAARNVNFDPNVLGAFTRHGRVPWLSSGPEYSGGATVPGAAPSKWR
jgi:hypothetical protein